MSDFESCEGGAIVCGYRLVRLNNWGRLVMLRGEGVGVVSGTVD